MSKESKLRLRVTTRGVDDGRELISQPLYVWELIDPYTELVFQDGTTMFVKSASHEDFDVVPEMFTGVRDSLGSDIYEGDYIKAGFYDCPPNTGPKVVIQRFGCWYADGIGEIGTLSSARLTEAKGE